MITENTRYMQMLREKGLKVTNQRVAVLSILEHCNGQHLATEEIYDLVKKDVPEIGLATVYRTLQTFLEHEIVDKINFDDGYVRYEMAAGTEKSLHHHHHLICLKCGRVMSFADDLLEVLEDSIAVKTGFYVVDHEVKLYGYCDECKQVEV